MTRGIEIRPLLPSDDRLEVSRVYEKSWKNAYRDIIPQEYLAAIPEGRWAQTLDKPERRNLVMLKDGAVIGTSSFGASRFGDMDGYGEIVSLYLLPEYTHKGYGGALLRKAVEALRDTGFTDVFLWVLEENLIARRFYEAFGFERSAAFLDENIGGRVVRELQYIYHAETAADNTNRKG